MRQLLQRIRETWWKWAVLVIGAYALSVVGRLPGLLFAPSADRYWVSYDTLVPDGKITYQINSCGRGESNVLLVWTTADGVRHSFIAAYCHHDVNEDIEFRLAEDEKGIFIISYVSPADEYLDGPAGRPIFEGALDFSTVRYWPGKESMLLPVDDHDAQYFIEHKRAPRRDYERYLRDTEQAAEITGTPEWPMPDWNEADPDAGEPIGRWLMVTGYGGVDPYIFQPVYVHWSPRFASTVLRKKTLLGDGRYELVVESGDPIYRHAELRGYLSRPDYLAFVDYSSPDGPRVCATLDCHRREFIDDKRFLWCYGEKADEPITKSSNPVASYPDWATAEAGEVIARPHKPQPDLPETRNADQSQQ